MRDGALPVSDVSAFFAAFDAERRDPGLGYADAAGIGQG
jgi:hypothetical protein